MLHATGADADWDCTDVPCTHVAMRHDPSEQYAIEMIQGNVRCVSKRFVRWLLRGGVLQCRLLQEAFLQCLAPNPNKLDALLGSQQRILSDDDRAHRA